MSFRVVSNAADAHALPAAGTPFSIAIDEGCSNIGLLNQKLACIDSKNIVTEMEALLKDEASLKKSGHTYVVVSKNRDDGIIQGLRSLVQANNEALWVLPIRPADASSLTFFREPGITRIPWEI